jgi:hypothetical protein
VLAIRAIGRFAPSTDAALPPRFHYHRLRPATATDSVDRGHVDCPVLASLYCGGPNGRRGMIEVEWNHWI